VVLRGKHQPRPLDRSRKGGRICQFDEKSGGFLLISIKKRSPSASIRRSHGERKKSGYQIAGDKERIAPSIGLTRSSCEGKGKIRRSSIPTTKSGGGPSIKTCFNESVERRRDDERQGEKLGNHFSSVEPVWRERKKERSKGEARSIDLAIGHSHWFLGRVLRTYKKGTAMRSCAEGSAHRAWHYTKGTAPIKRKGRPAGRSVDARRKDPIS